MERMALYLNNERDRKGISYLTTFMLLLYICLLVIQMVKAQTIWVDGLVRDVILILPLLIIVLNDVFFMTSTRTLGKPLLILESGGFYYPHLTIDEVFIPWSDIIDINVRPLTWSQAFTSEYIVMTVSDEAPINWAKMENFSWKNQLTIDRSNSARDRQINCKVMEEKGMQMLIIPTKLKLMTQFREPLSVETLLELIQDYYKLDNV